MRGILDCCARADGAKPIATPPTSEMKSRRLIEASLGPSKATYHSLDGGEMPLCHTQQTSAYVRNGSTPAEVRRLRHVRSASNNGLKSSSWSRRRAPSAKPKSAP